MIDVPRHRTTRVIGPAFALWLAGCSSTLSFLPGAESRPPMIVATAFTGGGCVEKLKKEAERRNVKIEVTKVTKELGVGAFAFPFFRDYQCHGEVQSPTAVN